jgi:hypothetical protein
MYNQPPFTIIDHMTHGFLFLFVIAVMIVFTVTFVGTILFLAYLIVKFLWPLLVVGILFAYLIGHLKR